MHTPSRYWADWTTRDFSQRQSEGTLAQTIAVLPLGATEQHGPHLPLSVDTMLVNGVVASAVRHVADPVPALFLPTQAVGFSPEHAAFAGTLTLKSETLLRLWTDIGESVAASGVKKLVLFNAHGGQVGAMDLVARELRARLGMLVFSVNWYQLPLVGPQGEDVNALFDTHEHRFGVHAGDIETSMMLALAPERVDMAQAHNFASASEERARRFAIVGNGKSAKLAWQMQDYNPAGAAGNAAAATAHKGQALVDAAGRALAQLLAEVHHMPLPAHPQV
jgi:creatinine amidohydrolase